MASAVSPKNNWCFRKNNAVVQNIPTPRLRFLFCDKKKNKIKKVETNVIIARSSAPIYKSNPVYG